MHLWDPNLVCHLVTISATTREGGGGREKRDGPKQVQIALHTISVPEGEGETAFRHRWSLFTQGLRTIGTQSRSANFLTIKTVVRKNHENSGQAGSPCLAIKR